MAKLREFGQCADNRNVLVEFVEQGLDCAGSIGKECTCVPYGAKPPAIATHVFEKSCVPFYSPR